VAGSNTDAVVVYFLKATLYIPDIL